MNPFANFFIHLTVKAGQTIYRLVHQTNGFNNDVPEMYIMTRRTLAAHTANPTSFNDNAGQNPTTFTNTDFMVDEMRHDITCKVDSSCTATDDLGNEYMKVVPM